MPRLARKQLQGKKIFHIMVQGINKEKIFDKDKYKAEYIKLLKKYKEKHNLFIITYCIMSNHAHILIYTDNTENLTKYMHEVNTSYATYYNKNNNRVGYVYRDRFKVQVINDRGHLNNCIIYIHNNPVKAKICALAKEYKFSGYSEFLSLNEPTEIIGLFNDKIEYENSHNIINMTDMSFLEDEESVDFDINNEINEYLKLNKIKREDLILNEYFLGIIVRKISKK